MHIMTEAREAALKALYRMDVADGSPAECLEGVCGPQFPPEVKKRLAVIFFGVVEHLKEMDRTIAGHSKNWTLDRMPVIDRNILRIAVYELLYSPDVPYRVVIDEAVEIAKRFGSEDSGAFVNGVLDTLAKDIVSGAVCAQ
ncbi:MAG TPA: transcription antitermination factor NusB [Thermodesulfobacteriota bacterium]|nr:transcription antitermination factor NusB [Thermodesulfobacteriota bacterium]